MRTGAFLATGLRTGALFGGAFLATGFLGGAIFATTLLTGFLTGWRGRRHSGATSEVGRLGTVPH